MASAAQWRRALDDLAAKYGGTVEATNGGHLRIVLTSGAAVFCSSTPKNQWREVRDTEALLRRAAKTCANGQH